MGCGSGSRKSGCLRWEWAMVWFLRTTSMWSTECCKPKCYWCRWYACKIIGYLWKTTVILYCDRSVPNDRLFVSGTIFKDMLGMFDNDVFHMGGDEVDFRCYNTTKEITDWMLANGYTLETEEFFRLWGEFQEKRMNFLVKIQKPGRTSQLNKTWYSWCNFYPYSFEKIVGGQ